MPYLFLTLLLVLLDQLVKRWVTLHIPLGGSVPFLPHVLELAHVRNSGAAFSILEEHTWFLTLCSLVMSVVLLLALWKGFFHHPAGKVTLAVILAGAVGNLIDRFLNGYVVDMFHVLLFRIAVFNVADMCVVGGGAAALVYYLFFYERLEAPMV